MVLPITNFVNVTVTETPQGLSIPNVNSLMLFTTETPSNLDDFRVYLNASQVAEDYGSASKTTEMANVVFAQSPSILSGGGRLVIAPLQSAVSATQGDFTTSDISANLSNLQGVSDGDLRITLNGTAIDLTGLDFTAATSLADIVTILSKESSLANLILENVGNIIVGTSKKVGASSAVIFEQLPAGSGTDLSGATFFDTANGTATVGADAQGETIAAAITRLGTSVEYFPIISNLEMEDAIITSLATTISGLDKIFYHHFSDRNDILDGGICDLIKDASQEKFRCLFYSTSPESANIYKTAYTSKQHSVVFSGSATARTDNLDDFVSVTPDESLTQTDVNNAVAAGAIIYTNTGGIGAVKSSGANNFTDSVINKLALKLNLEVAGFNYLKTTNTKVPQTEAGMNGLKGAYRKVMEQFVTNGVFGEGLKWNSSQTFGNPEDFKRNITDFGFYIFSQPIALQSQADRDDRKAPLIQIAAKFAGAIHTSDVLVTIER